MSVIEKFTKCDSGETLNPLMHAFLFATFAISVGFLFFSHTASIQAFVLYQQTLLVGQGYVNFWGMLGFTIISLHCAAFWFRGKFFKIVLPFVIFGGFYMWLWAALIYISSGFFFQLFVLCVPNLWFWAWYAWQTRKRVRGDRVAFV